MELPSEHAKWCDRGSLSSIEAQRITQTHRVEGDFWKEVAAYEILGRLGVVAHTCNPNTLGG